MNVKERIKEFTKYSKITVSAFEKSILVTNGYVNSISKSIGIDKIGLILEKYPNLNIEWLLAGKGEMLKDMGDAVKEVFRAVDNIDYKELAEARLEIIEGLKFKIATFEREQAVDLPPLPKDVELALKRADIIIEKLSVPEGAMEVSRRASKKTKSFGEEK
jgi:hypothetical protein